MTPHDEQEQANSKCGTPHDVPVQQDRETKADRRIVETYQELDDVVGIETDDVRVDPCFLEVLEKFRDANPAEVVFATGPGMTYSEESPAAIGRFQILRQLGQGGYGVVFLALDPELKRQVALKVPRPEVLVTGSLRQRFLREAEAAAALNHANVVPVFESGNVGPLCFIASAYCEGPDLESWVQQQSAPVEFRRAARWVQQLAEAMQHAHARGVWHRDLKPSNVLLAPSHRRERSNEHPERWTPQVADFGLARLADSAVEQTRTGAILGTPAYMAPEQAAGHANIAGPHVDIYGLGAILYFLVTSAAPFAGDTPMATLHCVIANEPLRPSRSRGDVPRDLEAICLKCLEKDPDRRYDNATEVAEDLERFLHHEPVHARRITSWERVTRWCRRNPALSSLAMMLLLTLAAGTLGITGLWWRAEGERKKADQRATQLAEKSLQLRIAIDRLFAAVAESDEIRMVAAEPLRRRLLSEVQDYYDQFASQRPDDPQLLREHAASIFRLAEINALLGDRKAAAELSEQALWELDQQGELTSSLKEERARYQAFLAHQRFRAGEFEASRDLYRKALETREGLADANDSRRQLACLWAELAASELFAADTERAREAAAKSMDIWQEPYVRPDVHADLQVVSAYSQCLRTFGALSEMMGDCARSESYYDQAIQLLEPHVAIDSIDALDLREQLYHCRRGIGVARAQQEPRGEQDPLESASRAYEQSLDGFTQLVNEHPAVLRYREGLSDVRYSFAVTLMLRKKFDESKQLLETNVRDLRAFGIEFPDHRTTFLDRCGKDLNLLCVVCRRSQDPIGAKTVIEDALSCFDAVLADRPEWIETKIAKGEALNNYASVLYDLKKFRASLEQNLAARELLAPICQKVPSHRRAWRTFWHTFTNPVATYTTMRQYEDALRELRAYLRQRGDETPERDRLHEVWLLDQLQRYDEALAALNACVIRYRNSASMKSVTAKAAQLVERYTKPAEQEANAPEEYLLRLTEVATP